MDTGGRRHRAAGATWERLIGSTIHGEKTRLPVGDIRLQADYRLADHNHPAHFIDARQIVEENNASANPKYCLAVAPFSGLNEPLQDLVGLDRLFEAYYEEPGHVKALIGRLAEAQRESFRLLAECGCDGVMIYDDWGLQDRLMISLPMIQEFFGPHYRANWEYAHSLGMDTWVHSCGYIIELLPLLREWGLDVIQQDQQENMGLEALDAVAGGRLAFWCPVDIQKTMADGSVDDIRAYVGRMMATLGNHAGGLISKRYRMPKRSAPS